jgi:hypothetical protein
MADVQCATAQQQSGEFVGASANTAVCGHNVSLVSGKFLTTAAPDKLTMP